MSLKLILLIAAIQVVAGILAKRKQKQKAEEARGAGTDRKHSGAIPQAPGMERDMEAQKREQRGKAEMIRGRASYDEDEEDGEEEWEEHHPRGETRDSRPGRPSSPTAGKPQGPADLLTQLAKELGLQFPIPTTGAPAPGSKPRPAPKPAPSVPKPAQSAPRSATESAAARPTATAQRVADAARRPDRPASKASSPESARTVRQGGESMPRLAPSNVPVTQETAARAAYDPAIEGLGDPEALRRAFVLKTVLDKPLALRPRRLGEG
jgi:hypothetical protein